MRMNLWYQIQEYMISILISEFGTADYDLTVELFAVDVDGKPTGAALSTGSISKDQTSPTKSWELATMTSYNIVSGTKYAIVLSCPNGISNKSYKIYIDTSGTGFAGGTAVYSNTSGSSWIVYSSQDQPFRTYGTSLELKFPMPCFFRS